MTRKRTMFILDSASSIHYVTWQQLVRLFSVSCVYNVTSMFLTTYVCLELSNIIETIIIKLAAQTGTSWQQCTL